MGSCISLQISCDQVLTRAYSCFFSLGNYIHKLKDNIVALEKAIEDLTATRDDVLRRVQMEEGKGLERLQQVQVWLKRVEIIRNQFYDLLSARNIEIQRLCFYSNCSTNLSSSYTYGQRVFLMIKEVENLNSNGFFEIVAAPAPKLEMRPIQPTIMGRETIFQRAWNRLMDDGVGTMGLYGMGGVGKTTLLTQIHNTLHDTKNGVDIVIWVVVSSDLQIHKIQEDIGEKLGFIGKEWNKKQESQKAVDILNCLSKKRFVLLLDDIWKKVDLTKIGIPSQTRENKCKVVFTTRSLDVCARMGVHDPMEVQCLSTNDAWELFQEKVGQISLGSHPDILELAKKVAGKCRGLPLALNVIGETMAGKRAVQEWHHAVDVLTSYAAEFSGMDDHILLILKYSYDNLNDKHVRSCFQYCALYPEDYSIKKYRLIDYWICEGFIDGNIGKERAVNQGYEILGTLVRACLLSEEGKNKLEVKMHDVVREMALWTLSDLGKNKERCIVQAGSGLRKVPKVEDWGAVRRLSLMNNGIEEISGSPECPELTTLFLQENKSLVHISGEFFRHMRKLVVLDLSENHQLDGLPEQISELVALRYLDLSHTNIEGLPACLQDLKTLIHLNLECMRRLGSIAGISKLSSLRTLGLRNSNIMLDVMSVKELHLLEHLEILTIDIVSTMVLEQMIDAGTLMNCMQEVSIRCLIYDQEQDTKLRLPTMDSLRSLTMWNCEISEIEIERLTWNTNPTSPCFFNLSQVIIHVCSSLKDLTWLLFAPNITYLMIEQLEQLQELISHAKATGVTEEEQQQLHKIIPFQKLQILHLSSLPELKSIYWISLSFPCLSGIYVERCPKLRKLPLDSKTGTVGKKFVLQYKETEWIESVEWKDEATKLHFLPSTKLVYILS
ncbi:putative disease resistance protein [Arabidopsis thaliana]|uniref:Putative disease resistance protein At4g10780 n=2 Tax=Arabidopsis thaliana TaxID=3702 RepID=DRL23_ARATH|nr:LRR and NB-ARC domains-containing disease resistance protein [Arabidopsis thaliana]O82484.1 RecName: Full=Putative disease resistance protein At4g10780 [Arabidopsis thaliana]AAC35528.1 similar to Arabidopsis thaliana disease resistance protein RPS2 (GB:U14158) [Arabidopsis thaliana]AEE82928.1 LRR and NB-ARC domains-containing disease resistance protein [Arabidopsis thaliana]CAB81179.1 putative disease resistance protein [Arabidopsis thaliana]|eukprot:NP_192816.1 LRR and NB-ARC domains-containing disease resistance protein [Arabidopsis thaliana]